MACLRAERFGDYLIDALTVSTFSGVLTVLGLPGDFLFSVDPVARWLEIHSKIAFRSGTDAFRPIAKRVWNAVCVAITKRLLS
jgi:hypothetical protein